MKFDPFLTAMAAAVALALVAPQIGASEGLLHLGAITDLGIMLVFFLHGAGLSPEALKAGFGHWRLHAFVQASTFVLFPAIGFAVYFLAAPLIGADVRLGFFFLCSLSSTISSSVALTGLARGNVSAAVFNATLSGLIGMLATPALVGIVLAASPQPLPLLDTIGDVMLKLLAPFAAGQVARIWIAGFMARHKSRISIVDRSVIVLIVLAAFSDSTAAGLWTRYGLDVLATIVALAAGLLAIVLFATRFASRWFGFSRADEVTAVFCGSVKSLANGAPIAKIIFAGHPAAGLILLPVLLYHQFQLIACSFLARRYAAAAEAEGATVRA